MMAGLGTNRRGLRFSPLERSNGEVTCSPERFWRS
jgi:hypothetical protein